MLTADLRALAEASAATATALGIPLTEWCNADDLIDLGFTEDGAAYIAAANPAAVLALLDERDALRAEVDAAGLAVQADARATSEARARADAAEAEVERIRGFRVLCQHHYDNGPDTTITGNLGCPICLINERDEARAEVERLRLAPGVALESFLAAIQRVREVRCEGADWPVLTWPAGERARYLDGWERGHKAALRALDVTP